MNRKKRQFNPINILILCALFLITAVLAQMFIIDNFSFISKETKTVSVKLSLVDAEIAEKLSVGTELLIGEDNSVSGEITAVEHYTSVAQVYNSESDKNESYIYADKQDLLLQIECETDSDAEYFEHDGKQYMINDKIVLKLQNFVVTAVITDIK